MCHFGISQITWFVSIIKTNWLIHFKEIVAVNRGTVSNTQLTLWVKCMNFVMLKQMVHITSFGIDDGLGKQGMEEKQYKINH
jgi:hypothetical protein